MRNKITIAILVIAPLLMLVGCDNTTYTYEVKFSNGDVKTITTTNQFHWEDGTDCIAYSGCGCSGDTGEKYCGVREFYIVSTQEENEIETPDQEEAYQNDEW